MNKFDIPLKKFYIIQVLGFEIFAGCKVDSHFPLLNLFFFRYVAESSEPASKKSKDSEGSTTTTGTAINQRTTTTTTTESLNTNLPSLSNQNSTRDQLKSTTTNERTSEEQREPGLQKEAVKSVEEKDGDQKDKKVNNKEPSALNSTFEASIKGLEEDLLKIPGTAVSLQKLFSILNHLRCKRIPSGTSKTGSCLQHSQKVRSLLNYQCLNSSAKQFYPLLLANL